MKHKQNTRNAQIFIYPHKYFAIIYIFFWMYLKCEISVLEERFARFLGQWNNDFLPISVRFFTKK